LLRGRPDPLPRRRALPRVPRRHPLIFHTACARLGIAPAEAAYVGDRRDTDAEAATAAGLTGIWINRTPAPGGLSDLRHLAGVLGLTPTDLGSPAPVG